ncbi:MAG: TonB-dependent receptor [Pseudomonadota bacterium]
MRLNRRHKSVLLGSAAALALATAPATAQDDAQGNTDEGVRQLGEITVTATRREASIQDVPIAVSAFSPETLDRQGVFDVTNLESVTPSFNINSSDTATGGSTLRVRGVGTTGNNIGLESSVAVFVDGVYLSRPGVALGDLVDLEQLELLRGPQGTLFGRNTSAGALNITTRKPSLDTFDAFANATYGNFDLFNVQAGFSAPIIEDRLGVRFSGAYTRRDGFIDSLSGPSSNDSNDRDRYLIRGQAMLDLDDFGTFRLIGDYSEANERCCFAVFFEDTPAAALFGAAGLDPTGGAPFQEPDARNDLQSNSDNFSNPFEQWGISGEYNVDLPFGSLTYIGAFRDFEDATFRNTDFVGLNIFTVGASPEAMALPGMPFDPNNNASSIETQTHELRLNGTLFEDRIDWLFGLYYSDELINAEGSLTLLDEFQSGVSVGTLGSAANLLNIFSQGVDATGDFATNSFRQDAESFSIFTHNVISITDNLDFTVGLRYVDETKDGTFEQVAGEHDACLATLGNAAGISAISPDLVGTAVALNCFVFTAPTVDRLAEIAPGQELNPLAQALLPQEFDDTFEDDELVYTLRASYALTPDVTLFGGFTHGFKSGGFNLDASAAVAGFDPRFESEEIDVWEFGIKSTLFDGRARANLTVFHQDISDFQVLEFTGVQFVTFNVDQAFATGFEIETLAQITDFLTANFDLTYSDARYPNDCAVQDPTDPGFNLQAANLCGGDLTNAPEVVGVFGLTYEQPVINGRFNLFANANVRFESERRTSTQPSVLDLNDDTPLAGDIQDENAKLNLRLGFGSEDGLWQVEVWGRNVTDQITRNVAFNIPLRGSARGQFLQDPRTFGVTVRTRF